jgi:hypothetical protein
MVFSMVHWQVAKSVHLMDEKWVAVMDYGKVGWTVRVMVDY